MSRNPLYFFSLLGWIGVGLATETFSFGIAFALAFGLVYPHIIRREEEHLRAKFGQAFTDYCARTPRFFPNPKAFHEPESYVVNPKVFRRAMGDVLWFIWLAGIIEFVEALHEYQFVSAVIRLP